MNTGTDPREERDFDAEFARLVAEEGEPPVAPRPAAEEPSGALRGGSSGPAAVDPEDEDLVLPGDFEEPDPDLPPASSALLWSWTAFLGGLALVLVVVFSTTLPMWLSAVGGVACLGGLVSLLLHVPRERSGPDDGVQV